MAPFFLIAYSPARYIIRNSIEEAQAPQGYQGGPLGIGAIFSAANLIDIVGTLVQAVKGRGGGNGFSLGIQNRIDRFADGDEQTQGFVGGRRQRRERRSRRY